MSTIGATTEQTLATRSLHFPSGVPGFPAARTFSMSTWGEEPSPFSVIECSEVEGLRFVVVPPVVFFPSYEPQLGPDVYAAVDAAGRDDVTVMVILTLHPRPEDTTANLLGPLVVNRATGRAVQAVLSASGFSPQTPIVER